MKLRAAVFGLGALACASGGASNEPQSGVRDVGTVSGAGSHLGDSKAASGTRQTLTRDLGPAYTAPDVGWRSTVPAPLDGAYHAIMEGYGVIGVDILTNDSRAHVVGNKSVIATQLLGQPLSKFLDCGRDGATGQARADSYRVIFSIISSFAAVDSATTRVTTLVTAEAQDRGTSASPIHCSSTGILERALLRAAGYPSS
jgi:hypothetical protein